MIPITLRPVSTIPSTLMDTRALMKGKLNNW